MLREGSHHDHKLIRMLAHTNYSTREAPLKDELADDETKLIYQVAVRFNKEDYTRLIAVAKDDDRHIADFCRKLLKWALPIYEEVGSFKALPDFPKKKDNRSRRTG